MTWETRKPFLEEIEKIRQRPLICYVTSNRTNAWGQMSSDVITEIAKQINCIDKQHRKVDILIVSNGGDPTVSWRIMSMLREKFENIGILLPFAAYSAATLLALGGDELLMHPFANLGPVDPQMYTKKQGTQDETLNFGSEDLRHYFEFIRKDVGISDQEQLQKSFDLVCREVGAIPIGAAKRSAQLALTMGEKLLRLHMQDESKAKAIAEEFNTSFYHHGYPLSKKEAISIGLPVKELDKNLEELMWNLWLDYELEMECSHPFNALEKVFEDIEARKILEPVQQIQLPSNVPPQIAQQIIESIVRQISIVSVKPVKYELFNAALESIRCISHFKTNGIINAVRNPDLSISVAVAPIKGQWIFEKKESNKTDSSS